VGIEDRAVVVIRRAGLRLRLVGPGVLQGDGRDVLGCRSRRRGSGRRPHGDERGGTHDHSSGNQGPPGKSHRRSLLTKWAPPPAGHQRHPAPGVGVGRGMGMGMGMGSVLCEGLPDRVVCRTRQGLDLPLATSDAGFLRANGPGCPFARPPDLGSWPPRASERCGIRRKTPGALPG
jgi:hypothetical protein